MRTLWRTEDGGRRTEDVVLIPKHLIPSESRVEKSADNDGAMAGRARRWPTVVTDGRDGQGQEHGLDWPDIDDGF